MMGGFSPTGLRAALHWVQAMKTMDRMGGRKRGGDPGLSWIRLTWRMEVEEGEDLPPTPTLARA